MWASTHNFGAYDISYYVQMPLTNFYADIISNFQLEVYIQKSKHVLFFMRAAKVQESLCICA